MDKFDEINKLRSYEAEALFDDMTEDEKEKLVCHVMEMYNKRIINEVSLTVLRLVYTSPYFSKNYTHYKKGVPYFLVASEKSVFNRDQVSCNEIFINKEFVTDILKGNFKISDGVIKRLNDLAVIRKEDLLSSIWQSYFYKPSTIKLEEVVEVCDLYFKLYDGKCKFSVQSLRNRNDKQCYDLYQYMSKNEDVSQRINFFEDGYFDIDEVETLYKDCFYKTLNAHTGQRALYQQLKIVSSYILNNTLSYNDIKDIWGSLQAENQWKVNLLPLLKRVDLSVKIPPETYKNLPDTIKDIIKEDPTRTECFMESIVGQFLQNNIIKENIILVNKILEVLKEDIKLNDNYKNNLKKILENHMKTSLFQKNTFKVELIQTLIDIEKDEKKLREIKSLLVENSHSSNSLVLIAYLEKKLIKDSIQQMENKEPIIKRRL